VMKLKEKLSEFLTEDDYDSIMRMAQREKGVGILDYTPVVMKEYVREVPPMKFVPEVEQLDSRLA